MNSSTGFILGLIGGSLNIVSATSLLAGEGGGTATPTSIAVVWAAGLYALGIALILMTVTSVRLVPAIPEKAFPVLTAFFGSVMLIVGWTMSPSGPMEAIEMPAFDAYFMMIIGALMTADGIVVSRAQT